VIRAILFDLDDTLYPREAGIMEQVRVLMIRYICTRLNLSVEQAEGLRHRYLQAYGTTMRGLQIHYQIDAEEYLHYVHNIPLQTYLQPNPALDGVLESIREDKVIFTNASHEHAEGVLDALGIRRHFRRIIDVRDMNYESKPQPAAYQCACRLLQVPPEQCLIVEDTVRNLQPAKAIGMTTILVNGVLEDKSVDLTIARIEDIGSAVARLTNRFTDPVRS